MFKVFQIDPHPVVCKGVKAFLKKSDQFTFVGSTDRFKQGFKWLKENPCDILITEMTYDIGPQEMIDEVLAIQPGIKIVFYSSQPQNMYAISILKAGANAFINKNVNQQAFLDALNQVQKLGFPMIGSHGYLNLNLDFKQPRNVFETLSRRETEVLRMIMKGKRNKFIAETLGISPKTAATYKQRIFKKFKVKHVTELYTLNQTFKFV